MKANLFIVGAPKAGTTFLHYCLRQHPQVSMSKVKEPNFFSAKEVKKLYYNESPIEDDAKYSDLFDPQAPIKGEASVSYLYYESVAQRIYDYNAEAKIIAILRNPVERACSHYLMDTRLGYCENSLEDIIESPEMYPQHYQQYVELGCYSIQVKRYLDLFGKNNMLILYYDDLKSDPEGLLSNLFNFLKIPKIDVNLEPRNDSFIPRNKFISRIYKSKYARKIAKQITSENIAKSIRNWSSSIKTKPKPISTKTRQSLQQYYSGDIKLLEKELEVEIVGWKGNPD